LQLKRRSVAEIRKFSEGVHTPLQWLRRWEAALHPLQGAPFTLKWAGVPDERIPMCYPGHIDHFHLEDGPRVAGGISGHDGLP
jgi:hypothetical protein